MAIWSLSLSFVIAFARLSESPAAEGCCVEQWDLLGFSQVESLRLACLFTSLLLPCERGVEVRAMQLALISRHYCGVCSALYGTSPRLPRSAPSSSIGSLTPPPHYCTRCTTGLLLCLDLSLRYRQVWNSCTLQTKISAAAGSEVEVR